MDRQGRSGKGSRINHGVSIQHTGRKVVFLKSKMMTEDIDRASAGITVLTVIHGEDGKCEALTIGNLSFTTRIYNRLLSLCKCCKPTSESSKDGSIVLDRLPLALQGNRCKCSCFRYHGAVRQKRHILIIQTSLQGMTVTMNATKTVLVIDDEAATLTMFRLFLNAYGYSVLTAENGETGLQLVREHHPGIVFTDLKMPGMDGFEVLKQIKKMAPETEVVVITGHGDMDHVVRALNLDATDFVNKPIGRSALDAALKRAEARLNDDRRDNAPLHLAISSGVGIVSIHGTLSGLHKNRFAAYLHRALDSGAKGIVIRFDSFSAVNGTGIALLTRLLSETRATGTPVFIVGLSENFKTIFDMVGITRVAPCVDTVETAISAMGRNKTM